MAGLRAHFTLEELAPGVHAAVATPDGFALCNAGIVDLGGACLVFDAMLTPQAAEALRRSAERLTGRPVDYLVNSHYHGDHVRGNSAIQAVRIVSSQKVRDLVIERAARALESERAEVPGELEGLRSGKIPAPPADRRAFEGWYEGILATPPGWTVRPPDLTFDAELVVRGSRRSARILSFGGGHSPSDVFVHLPEERIAFLGDLVSNGFHPCLWDGDPAVLVRILRRIRALGVDRALPGHGPVSEEPAIVAMERYVEMLHKTAGERIEEGISPDDTAGVLPPPPFDRWVFSSFYSLNLSFVQRGIARSSATPTDPLPPSRGSSSRRDRGAP